MARRIWHAIETALGRVFGRFSRGIWLLVASVLFVLLPGGSLVYTAWQVNRAVPFVLIATIGCGIVACLISVNYLRRALALETFDKTVVEEPLPLQRRRLFW